jgi:hypothetical protein
MLSILAIGGDIDGVILLAKGLGNFPREQPIRAKACTIRRFKAWRASKPFDQGNGPLPLPDGRLGSDFLVSFAAHRNSFHCLLPLTSLPTAT